MSSADAPISFKQRLRDAGLSETPAPRRPIVVPISAAGGDSYGRKALEEECLAVANCREGSRNDQLNTSAFNLASLVASGHLEHNETTERLIAAARHCGLSETEIMPTIKSAFRGSDAKVGARVVSELEPIRPAAGIDEDGQTNAAPPELTYYDLAVQRRLDQLRIDHEARTQFEAENRPTIEYPPVRSLAALLNQPCPSTRWRIDQVAPVDARILLSAQYKAGKTTLTGNLARSLVDGCSFLGRFAVNTPVRALVLIDNELSEHTVQAWLRDQDINNTEAVADVVTLRGNMSAFNLLDEHCRAVWAQRFRALGADYLILDCLRPILDALGLSEDKDAGRFLVAFDALLKEAGIGDALLVQHMGHSNERARGDSRLQDWPDANWRLVREDDEDPSSARYFSAYGRDVDVAEGRLDFDAATRRLTYLDGSRKSAKVDGAVAALPEILSGADIGDGLTQNALRAQLTARGVSFGIARQAISRAVQDGTILRAEGPNRSQLHILNPSRGSM